MQWHTKEMGLAFKWQKCHFHISPMKKEVNVLVGLGWFLFRFGFSGWKVMRMVYEHKKNRVSVSAMISLTESRPLAQFNLQPLQKRAHLTVDLLMT